MKERKCSDAFIIICSNIFDEIFLGLTCFIHQVYVEKTKQNKKKPKQNENKNKNNNKNKQTNKKKKKTRTIQQCISVEFVCSQGILDKLDINYQQMIKSYNQR